MCEIKCKSSNGGISAWEESFLSNWQQITQEVRQSNFIISLKTWYNVQSLRNMRVKIRKKWMPWAEPRVKSQIRLARSLANIPMWTGPKTNRRLFLEFPLSCSQTYTPSYTHIYIYKYQCLYYICFKIFLKFHNTEHHIILNIAVRHDDWRLSRRHIWAFKKELSDLSDPIVVSLKSSRFLHIQLWAHSLQSSWWNDITHGLSLKHYLLSLSSTVERSSI